MELPILEKLKDGVKFDFTTLADSVEQADLFWDWWWKEKYNPDEFSRPEVIVDQDEMLVETSSKGTVNLFAYADLFDKFLPAQFASGKLPVKDGVSREWFRKQLVQIIAANSTKLPGRPQIVFAGGGYGSGKTTILNELAQSGVLPVGAGHHVGVDVFKQLIPEYNLIKAVADGRASLTVQKECQMLANQLFDKLLEAGRSFIWDSSMSDEKATVERIKKVQALNYETMMIAVLTPLELAQKQAMERAFDSRRFPHPTALPQSHHGFRRAFTGYVPYFDEVFIFARETGQGHAMVVAEKAAGTKELVILDEEVFNRALHG